MPSMSRLKSPHIARPDPHVNTELAAVAAPSSIITVKLL